MGIRGEVRVKRVSKSGDRSSDIMVSSRTAKGFATSDTYYCTILLQYYRYSLEIWFSHSYVCLFPFLQTLVTVGEASTTFQRRRRRRGEPLYLQENELCVYLSDFVVAVSSRGDVT